MVFLPLLGLKGSKRSLSSAEALAGYPIKIAIIEIYQARGGRWGEGKGAFLLSFPFPSCLARFPFLLPSLPTTQEASAEERGKRPINAKHSVSIAIGSHIVDKEGARLIAEVKTIKGSVHTW